MTQTSPDIAEAAPADPGTEAASIGAALLLADLHEAVAEAAAQLMALTGAATVSVPLAPAATSVQSTSAVAPPVEGSWPASTPPDAPMPVAAPGWPDVVVPGAPAVSDLMPATGVDPAAPPAAGGILMPDAAVSIAPGVGASVPTAAHQADGFIADEAPSAQPAAPSWSGAANAVTLAPPFFLPSLPGISAPVGVAESSEVATNDGATTTPWSQNSAMPSASSATMWNTEGAAGQAGGAIWPQPTGAQYPGSTWSRSAMAPAIQGGDWPSQAGSSDESAAAKSPVGASSAAPPPRQAQGPTGGDVFLDGTRVGRWLSDTLAREAGGPATGGTGFDPRLSPTWPGALQGNGA